MCRLVPIFSDIWVGHPVLIVNMAYMGKAGHIRPISLHRIDLPST